MVETVISGGISEMLGNRLHVEYESKRRSKVIPSFFFF